MVLDSKTEVKGTGTIKEADVKADGVTFEKVPEKQTVDAKVTSPPPTPPPASSGGGGGGGSSTVYVSAVSVRGVGDATTVINGTTLQMNADVQPNNASNKAVTWSVEAGTGSATISTAGILTATGVGTVTVTATAQDGSNKVGSLEVTVFDSIDLPASITISVPDELRRYIQGEDYVLEDYSPLSFIEPGLVKLALPEISDEDYYTTGGRLQWYNGSRRIGSGNPLVGGDFGWSPHWKTDPARAHHRVLISLEDLESLVGEGYNFETVLLNGEETTEFYNHLSGKFEGKLQLSPLIAENNNSTTTAAVLNDWSLVAPSEYTYSILFYDDMGRYKEVNVTIKVEIAISSIIVSSEDNVKTIASGGTIQMNAAITPESATNKNITWSVEDGTGSATINEDGLLTATGNGSVTVKAFAQDGSGVQGTKEIEIAQVVNTTEDVGYDTIQGAINAATEGDIILVSTGTYEENLELDVQRLTLKAASKHEAVIQTVSGFNAGSGYGGITVLADDVTIDGFTIEQNVPQAVIHTHDSDNVSINNNYIISTSSARGIDVGYASAASNNVTIEGNKFEDLYCGVYVNQGSNLRVIDNEFNDMVDGAIVFDGTWANTDNIEVKDNVATEAVYLLYFFNNVGSVSAESNSLVGDTELSNYGISNTGQNLYYETLQEAVIAAATDSGDTISVGAGTYDLTNDVFTKSITLIGAGDDTILNSQVTQHVSIAENNYTSFKDLSIIGPIHINDPNAIDYTLKFENISFVSFDQQISYILGIWGSKELEVKDSRFCGPNASSQSAINVFKGDATVDRNVSITANLFDYSDVSVTGVRGVQAENINTVVITGNTFIGNSAAVDNVEKAFQIAKGVESATISGNTISYAKVGVMLHSTLNVEAEYNDIKEDNEFIGCTTNVQDDRTIPADD